MNKKLSISIILSTVTLFIILIAAFVFYPKTLASFSGLTIGFQKSPLENLLSYSTICGNIKNFSPVEINLNNVFIKNNSITTTAFEQNYPLKTLKVVIRSNKNYYTMEEYTNNTIIGIYNFTLNNSHLTGTFKNSKMDITYKFEGELCNYDSGSSMLIHNINIKKAVNKHFLSYPFFKGYLGYIYKKNDKASLTIAYNKYTNSIVEFSNEKGPYILKIVHNPCDYGIRLNRYYKNNLIGFYSLSYYKGYWVGLYNKLPSNSINYVSFIGTYTL